MNVLPFNEAAGKEGADRSLHWHVLGGNNKNRIGMNSGLCVYEETGSDGQKKTRSILFDAGSLFGDAKYPEDPALCDFDTVIPDFTRFLAHEDPSKHTPERTLDALFLTHNHSDHIGALPLLLTLGYKLPKIYATPYTAERLKQELSAFNIDPEKWPEITHIAPGRATEIGPVKVSAFWVSHSTPQSVGYFIETPEGNILTPGDFKPDQSVIWGPAFNEAHYKKLVERSVDLMLMDSTGADRDVIPTTEEDVRETLRVLMDKYPNRRFIVAVMSGFEENLASAAKVAGEYGRTIFVAGSSHELALKALADTGMTLADSIGEDIDVRILATAKAARELAETRPGSAMVIVTGAQGMSGAALPRALDGHHPHLTLDTKRDVILFCAPSIPGQEGPRQRLLHGLREKGFLFFTRQDMPLYSQAHARLPEIIDMAKMTGAKTILPAHGSKELREACAEAMAKIGQNILQAENGDVIRITKDGCRRVDADSAPRMLGFKTLTGTSWSDKSFLMIRLPLKNPQTQTPANNNGKQPPKIFDITPP